MDDDKPLDPSVKRVETRVRRLILIAGLTLEDFQPKQVQVDLTQAPPTPTPVPSPSPAPTGG